jgi:hypothetical protein
VNRASRLNDPLTVAGRDVDPLPLNANAVVIGHDFAVFEAKQMVMVALIRCGDHGAVRGWDAEISGSWRDGSPWPEAWDGAQRDVPLLLGGQNR